MTESSDIQQRLGRHEAEVAALRVEREIDGDVAQVASYNLSMAADVASAEGLAAGERVTSPTAHDLLQCRMTPLPQLL